MQYNDSGWAQFWGEASTFSESFREQMSEQLFQTFYAMLGVRDETAKRFLLQVGAHEMKTLVRDQYAFALVTVVSPTAYAKIITAYWKREDNQNPLEAVNDTSLSRSTIEFGWCADFDRDFFLEFIKPKKRIPKKKNNLNFTVEYDYSLYPDLSLTIFAKNNLDEASIEIIHATLSRNISNSYISEITNESDQYCGILDFQDTPYEKGTAELLVAFQELSKLNISSSITKISIQ